jgi:AcrR family transcriptional regulator
MESKRGGNGIAGDVRASAIDRLLTAAGEEAQAVGPDRVRMGKVADRAGISRASLYRYFANKDALLQAYTIRELDSFFERIDKAMEPFETVEERLGAGFAYAIPAMRKHPLFAVVFEDADHESLRTTLLSGDVLAHARKLIAERMNKSVRRGLYRIDQFGATVTGEMLARLLISILATPESIARLETAEDAREFAMRYGMPLLAGLTRDAS